MYRTWHLLFKYVGDDIKYFLFSVPPMHRHPGNIKSYPESQIVLFGSTSRDFGCNYADIYEIDTSLKKKSFTYTVLKLIMFIIPVRDM